MPANDPTASARANDGALLALLATCAASSAEAWDYGVLKTSLRNAVAKDPFDAAVITVLGGAFLFYLAERGVNPKVGSYGDALVFVSTCLSVGYADVFARTPAGKAIAAAVMTFGPTLSGAMFDRPAAPESAGTTSVHAGELLAVQHLIVEKLEAILATLRANA